MSIIFTNFMHLFYVFFLTIMQTINEQLLNEPRKPIYESDDNISMIRRIS